MKWETAAPRNLQGREVLKIARELVSIAHSNKVPVVLDPFAGGGAIPLEAGRLGCYAIANEYNPVAHTVLRATCELPQKFGKPLVSDVKEWAEWILQRSQSEFGTLYPAGNDQRPIIAYLWSRSIPCMNRTCQAEIPMLRSLVLRRKSSSNTALELLTDERTNTIDFGIVRGSEIHRTDGTKSQRGPVTCPLCHQKTFEADIRTAAVNGLMKERMFAVVVETRRGKDYRIVEPGDVEAYQNALAMPVDRPNEYIVPEINSPNANPNSGSHRSINLELYGFTKWGQLFNHRQLVVMKSLIEGLNLAEAELRKQGYAEEYIDAVLINLALWIDRIAAFGNTMCRWSAGSEIVKTPFGGQSVPMMWDYPEVNPFADSSGTASTQLGYMLNVLMRECEPPEPHVPSRILLGSATKMPLDDDSCEYVITDPPYGNSIAYADLSDFFYVWLKRSLGHHFPDVFRTPQTPKEEEATSHRHRHQGSQGKANEHYRRLLTESFKECRRIAKPPKLISVMFAHQTTQAWIDLISALFDAGLSPVATWPIATEMPNTALAMGTASLETSVTVVCQPRVTGSSAVFRDVRKEIEAVVAESVHKFWGYGFRGADLVVACYGPAVGVFGHYERVERLDGTLVEVAELLDLVKELALKAIAGEFTGDSLSRLYFVWANLYGTSEQPWDDARIVIQIGGDSEDAMEVARRRGLFVLNGSKCRLALLADRSERRHMGNERSSPLIDQLHRTMQHWRDECRNELVNYLSQNELTENIAFWKLAQALFEVLPRNTEDWKLVSALLSERETLRIEARRSAGATAEALPFT